MGNLQSTGFVAGHFFWCLPVLPCGRRGSARKAPKAVHNLYLFVDTTKIGCVFYYYAKCINICGAEREKERRKRQRQMAAADNTFDSLEEEKSYANLWFQVLASLNTHAQVKMHNRQLKWKLTHELVSHSSHFHLEHQQQAHSTGEIVHKLSAQQSLAAPTKAARAGIGSSSRNRKQEQQRERERESLSPLTNQSPKCKPRS